MNSIRNPMIHLEDDLLDDDDYMSDQVPYGMNGENETRYFTLSRSNFRLNGAEYIL